MRKTQTISPEKLTDLARKIRQARVEANLSQAELGDKIGVSDKSVSAYEKARTAPPFDKLQKIADSTHKPIVYFSEHTDPNVNLVEKLASIERELAEVKQLLKERK